MLVWTGVDMHIYWCSVYQPWDNLFLYKKRVFKLFKPLHKKTSLDGCLRERIHYDQSFGSIDQDYIDFEDCS